MKEKIDLRAVAEAALREADGLVATTDGCKTPIDKCRAKKGPAECRVHCVEYFDRLCDAVTFEEAKQGLKEKYGIECIKRKYVRKVITDKSILAFIDGQTLPISEEDYEDSVKALWVVIEDLTGRFPKLDIPDMIFVGAQQKNPKERGCGSVDRTVTAQCFIAFNIKQPLDSASQQAYGHRDPRLNYDVVRHELAHTIMTWRILNEWQSALKTRCDEIGLHQLK